MRTVTLARGTEESGLCVMLQGLLDECARRNGGRLSGLGSRIGVEAQDAGEQATLIFGGGRCTVEAGLSSPDLVLAADSGVLPQVVEVPRVLGLPWLLSAAGQRLFVAAALGELRVHAARGSLRAIGPVRLLRATRAFVDLLQLLRLLSGGA